MKSELMPKTIFSLLKPNRRYRLTLEFYKNKFKLLEVVDYLEYKKLQLEEPDFEGDDIRTTMKNGKIGIKKIGKEYGIG